MTKQKIFFVTLLATLVSNPLFASYTVCSSVNLYYSNFRRDMGIKPLPGTVMGKRVIAFKGTVLVNHEFVEGLGQHNMIPYQVELTGEPVVLEKKGNQISGSSIFKQTATLSKRNLSVGEEIASEEVLCKTTWAMVP